MSRKNPAFPDDSEGLRHDPGDPDDASNEDLWFLPAPIEDEPEHLPPGPRAEPSEA